MSRRQAVEGHLQSLSSLRRLRVHLQARAPAGREAPPEGREEGGEALGGRLSAASGLEEPLAGGDAQLRVGSAINCASLFSDLRGKRDMGRTTR